MTETTADCRHSVADRKLTESRSDLDALTEAPGVTVVCNTVGTRSIVEAGARR